MRRTHAALATLALLLAAGGCRRAAPAPAVRDSVVPEMTGPQAFKERCEMCHGEKGQGFPTTHPPLVASDLVTARNVDVPIRIVLLGMQGERRIRDTLYRSPMPRYGTGIDMADSEVAAVLTYVRQSWGNAASAVTAGDVARVRTALGAVSDPVTDAQLRPLMR